MKRRMQKLRHVAQRAAAALACSVAAIAMAQSDSWSSRIQAEIGAATCTQAGQCRTIGIGNKACGGPTSYLAWSTAVSDEARLKQLVEAQAAAQMQAQQRAGAISNCMMLVDPGALCVAGRCVLSTERGSGAR